MPIVDIPGMSRAIVSNKPGNPLDNLDDPMVIDQRSRIERDASENLSQYR
jgi:hypothetical protein